MNLQTSIRSDLWLSISNSYLKENYTPAILDAMHHLSSVLRDKTGVDGDGASLVGQALGGDSPRLRVNKLQTETERSVQKGMEHLLRGLYLAVRNPRGHEQIEDSKDTADAIICFIDYLLNVLAEAQEPFTLSGFLEGVFDPDFVSSGRYAELLVNDIPVNKRLDTLIEVFRQRSEGDGRKLAFVVSAIIAKLNTDQVDQFLIMVSDELKVVRDEPSIRSVLQLLPPGLWPRLSEAARLRIENRLLRSIREGTAHPNSNRVSGGALGTWARAFLPHFSNKDDLARVLAEKLEHSDSDERRYVLRYFMGVLPAVVVNSWYVERCINAICKSVRDNEDDAINGLKDWIQGYPERWQRTFVTKLNDLTDPNQPAIYLSDGTPFLRSVDDISEEDIPF